MPVINRSALVPYSAAEMYALVDDIQAYPQFLPWCRSATEWSRGADEVKSQLLSGFSVRAADVFAAAEQ